MSRIHTVFAIVVPSMIVGGVLFGSAFGHADAGRSVGMWPSSDATVSASKPVLVAQADPRQLPRPPMPPMPPMPPRASNSPAPDHPLARADVTVQIDGHRIQIDGLREMVERHVDDALEAVRNARGLPPDVRDKIVKRIEKVKRQLERRLAHIDASDLDQLGDELGKLGDELGKDMDEFGKEMEKYGEQFGKDFAKRWDFSGRGQNSDESDDTDDTEVEVDTDDSDDDAAASGLGDLLRDDQHDQIRQLRADTDRKIADAKRALAQASEQLQRQLANPSASDGDIARAIDAVSAQEAAIRKARILAWHHARAMLDADQRQHVEGAVHRRHPR